MPGASRRLKGELKWVTKQRRRAPPDFSTFLPRPRVAGGDGINPPGGEPAHHRPKPAVGEMESMGIHVYREISDDLPDADEASSKHRLRRLTRDTSRLSQTGGMPARERAHPSQELPGRRGSETRRLKFQNNVLQADVPARRCRSANSGSVREAVQH